MNNFELKIWDDQGLRCTFYTVHQDGVLKNEADKFVDAYSEGEFKDAYDDLINYIFRAIGDVHGAKKQLFNRPENQVFGLPNSGQVSLGENLYRFPDFPLRWYALPISENILILFNGGIKDGRTNQESSLRAQWDEACIFAKRIEKEIKDAVIFIDPKNKRRLTNDRDEDVFFI